MKVLVTGGGGFLGGAIARRLAERGESVRNFSRASYPELEALGVESLRGDIADEEAVRRACEGCELVFHVAAKVGLWGKREEYYQANVVGTKNVLKACQDGGVRRLVFTSSPSVVFDGRDAEGIDESAPYPARFDSHYSSTKALAEEMVLSADGPGLGTVALRPHLVWGPGDRHIAPRIIAQAKAGALRRIGRGEKLVDTTYIDDAAQAHLLAASRLLLSPSIGGRTYFISSGEPRPLWEIIGRILKAAGVAPAQRSVPRWAAYPAACLMEGTYRLLGLQGEPRLTRFLVNQLSTAHWFDISAARKDLGYRPQVPIEEGFRRLEAWLRADSSATAARSA